MTKEMKAALFDCFMAFYESKRMRLSRVKERRLLNKIRRSASLSEPMGIFFRS